MSHDTTGHFSQMETEQRPYPWLNSIVFYVKNLASSLAFYRALDLTFVQEQHGSGAVHYSSTSGGILLEIYPEKESEREQAHYANTLRIGFQVQSVDETLQKLANLAIFPQKPAKDSSYGR